MHVCVHLPAKVTSPQGSGLDGSFVTLSGGLQANQRGRIDLDSGGCWVTLGRPLPLSELCLSRELDPAVCKPVSLGTSTLLWKRWRLRVTGLVQKDLEMVMGHGHATRHIQSFL